MSDRTLVSSGSYLEPVIGFSRAVRVGNMIVVGGTAPIKARLLDQEAIAGIGNLLADQILWSARINPGRPVGELSTADVDRLLRATRRAVRSAIADGGVHTLGLIPFRRADGHCPRDGAPMLKSTVGGRTSWWCSVEQAR